MAAFESNGLSILPVMCVNYMGVHKEWCLEHKVYCSITLLINNTIFDGKTMCLNIHNDVHIDATLS